MSKFEEGDEVHILAAGAVGNSKEPNVGKVLSVLGRQDGEQLYRVGCNSSGYRDESTMYESALSFPNELPDIKTRVRTAKEKFSE